MNIFPIPGLLFCLLLPAHAWQANDLATWAARAAVPVDGWPQPTLDARITAQLDAWLAGKRVVFIGEPDHYIHEKYTFRLLLIQYLLERGFHTIAMEMGRSDGARVNAYLQSGDLSHLARVGLYGYDGATRQDRSDAAVGMMAQVRENLAAGRTNFYSEEQRFFRELRRFASAAQVENLQWVGIDVDTYPGGGYEDLSDLLSAVEAPITQQLQAKLKRVAGESLAQEVARLDKVHGWMRDHHAQLAAVLGGTQARQAVNSVQAMADSFRFRLQQRQDGLLAAFRARERVMFRQFDELLADLGPDGKLIVMGHNMHLSKNYRWLSFGEGSQTAQMWPSIGAHIADSLPGEVFAFWMLYDQGQNGGHQCADANCPVPRLPGSVSAQVAHLDNAFFLPLMDLPLDHALRGPQTFRLNAGPGRGVLPKVADALFIVPTVTGLHHHEPP